MYLLVATLPSSTKRTRPPWARSSASTCATSGSTKPRLRASTSTVAQASSRARVTGSVERTEPLARGDHQARGHARRRPPERLGVALLAAEVEPAHEAEHLAQGRPRGRAQALASAKVAPGAAKDCGPLARQVRRGQQEDCRGRALVVRGHGPSYSGSGAASPARIRGGGARGSRAGAPRAGVMLAS